jgi:hypothetical protein
MVAGVAAAIPLYFLTRPEPPAAENAAPPAPVGSPDARNLYCAQRMRGNGVMVSTGTGCTHDGESAGPHSPTVTITREPEALVITGSDP